MINIASLTRGRAVLAASALTILLCVGGLLLAQGASAHTTRPTLMVSTSPDRSKAVALQGAKLPDQPLYIFATVGGTTINSVDFHLDEPRDGTPLQRELTAPYDFRGGTVSAATAWDPPAGSHSVGAFARWADGHTTSDTDTFTVTAPAPHPDAYAYAYAYAHTDAAA